MVGLNTSSESTAARPPGGYAEDDPRSFDPLDVVNGPRRLGHYVLLEKLGHGGMGVVYAAYDENLDRKVAIKLLRARASENTHQRLIREAQAMARLSHPFVVQIYEIAKLEDRTCVIMEFVDGVTLRDWMAAKRRSRGEILEVFIAAGRGLAAAHRKSLIHRDFKPDNVMISTDGIVKVMDFGLARGEDEAPETRPSESELQRVNALTTALTADGAVIGTPAYMAPEQIEGRKTDSRTDQFSFCVTLWEALFERRPFSAGSLSELSDVVAAGKFDQPERSKVPSWLRRVLRRGLAPDPAARWPSMDALLDALARDPTRRRRTWMASVAGLAFVAIGGIAIGSLERPAADRAGSEADLSTCELAGRTIEDQLERRRPGSARRCVRSDQARLRRHHLDARERVDDRLRERVVERPPPRPASTPAPTTADTTTSGKQSAPAWRSGARALPRSPTRGPTPTRRRSLAR